MGKNKLTLREYDPSKKVWQNIESKLNNTKGINELKVHTPPDSIWDKIEACLIDNEQLSKLPKHYPSNKVWYKIESQLAARKIISLPNMLKIAASILLFIGLGFAIKLIYLNNDSSIKYSEVWIEPIDLENWNTEEEKDILKIIEKNESEFPGLLQSEEYLTLKSEYSSLVDSKQLILKELSPYSDNVELELVLTKIELEKNSLVRSLIFFNLT